jgi:glutathione S-transferase
MTTTLTIATQKNYSSWSLRGWLVLKWARTSFSERRIPLDQPGYGSGRIAEVLAASPNGLVPAVDVDGRIIWDTLAIAEWAAEQAPDLWPGDRMTRAWARSVTAEMHSGFGPLRRDLPMNIRRRCAATGLPDETLRAITRVQAIWRDCRSAHAKDGPWLFGTRSIADAFYAPVATRFRSYGVPLDAVSQRYVSTALNDSAFLEWEADCVPDSWDRAGFPVIDGLYR